MKNRILLILSVIIVLVCKSLPNSGPSSRLLNYELASTSLEIPLTSAEKDLYKDCRVVKRRYRLASHSATVLVVDPANNPHAVHKPGFCLQSAGWQIAESSFAMPRGNARQIVAIQGDQKEQVVYWFTESGDQYPDVLRYRWRSTLSQFLPSHRDSAPLYVVIASRGELKWSRFLAAFPELAKL